MREVYTEEGDVVYMDGMITSYGDAERQKKFLKIGNQGHSQGRKVLEKEIVKMS